MDQSSIRNVSHYYERFADRYLDSVLDKLSAVSLIGPRASGKTTTAARHAASVVRLDVPAQAAVFRADPDAALRRFTEPILLDEWQEVPDVLAAVKRAVDADSRPGRFILTGSVRAEVEANTWPGTGRVVRVPIFPMTAREIQGLGVGIGIVERLFEADLSAFPPAAVAEPAVSMDVNNYLALALRGGFPDVIGRDDDATNIWLASYVEEVIHHDAALVRQGIDTTRFGAYLEAMASHTAGIVEESTILDAVRIDRRTAYAYWNVLCNLFIAEQVPAWWSNHLTRLVATEKRYLIDSGLAAAILKLTPDAVIRDINWIGRLIDTFVAAQIRPEIALSPLRPRLHHLRTKGGRQEVDLLVEFGGGTVAGIEVKATAAPEMSDARHLRWMRDELGDRFLMGIVLHTGPYSFQLDDKIIAAPISTLWA